MAKFKRGDVVVITGASSGIGRATALALADAGARLTLIARDADKLATLKAECVARGAEAIVAVADVTDAAAIARAAEVTERTYGRLDAWINNAGVGAVGWFTDVPLDVHAGVLATNVNGYLNGAYAALGIFRRARRGTLVNVASISGYIAQPTSAAYVTSKFAVRGLSYALRQDVGLERLRDVDVCLIHPQVVDTDVFKHMANYSGTAVDLKLPTVPADAVARAVVRVLKRPRRETYVGVFGRIGTLGHRFFPGPAEWMMIRLARAYYRDRPRDGAAASTGNVFGPPR